MLWITFGRAMLRYGFLPITPTPKTKRIDVLGLETEGDKTIASGAVLLVRVRLLFGEWSSLSWSQPPSQEQGEQTEEWLATNRYCCVAGWMFAYCLIGQVCSSIWLCNRGSFYEERVSNSPRASQARTKETCSSQQKLWGLGRKIRKGHGHSCACTFSIRQQAAVNCLSVIRIPLRYFRCFLNMEQKKCSPLVLTINLYVPSLWEYEEENLPVPGCGSL